MGPYKAFFASFACCTDVQFFLQALLEHAERILMEEIVANKAYVAQRVA